MCVVGVEGVVGVGVSGRCDEVRRGAAVCCVVSLFCVLYIIPNRSSENRSTGARMTDYFSESGCRKLSAKEKICPKSQSVIHYPLLS